MKIAAFLGVKDEIELIGAAIAHLRQIGVDHIIACDSRSTDGTRDVLATEAMAGDIEIIDLDDLQTGPAEEEALLADVIMRARRVGADWLLYCDADEFWLPATGHLRDCAALATGSGRDVDVILVARHNVVLLADGPCIGFPVSDTDHDRILVFTAPETAQESQTRLRADTDARWIAGSLARKIMLRPDRIVTTLPGGHQVLPEAGVDLTRKQAADIIIAHVPLSTQDRFARRARNIAIAHAANGDSWGPVMAWHWRRWLDNVERDGVTAELVRNRLSGAELAQMRADGTVMSVRDRLTQRRARRNKAQTP